MFFTPGGNSTQHRGVDSDIQIPGPYVTDEVGEKTLDYSLPPKKIDAFISQDAYVKEGAASWNQVNSDMIKVLSDKSRARVDKNDEFKKIVTELEKSIAKGKTLKISEVTKEKEKII